MDAPPPPPWLDELLRLALKIQRERKHVTRDILATIPAEVRDVIEELLSQDCSTAQGRQMLDGIVTEWADGADARLTSLREHLDGLLRRVSVVLDAPADTRGPSDTSAAHGLVRDAGAIGTPAPEDYAEFCPGVPRRIGPFELEERIGSGGMGDVYRARQPELDRYVALKVLPQGVGRKPEALHRFLQEARACARLSHPGIVAVYDSGIERGQPYIAMQLVRGVSVDTLLHDRRPLPATRSLQIAKAVADALAAAHEAGIIHRDVKPGNILIEGDAESARREGRVFLVDFGLALLREAEPLTTTGEILGSPAFMSPEQARGTTLDRTTDVYSLGATLFAMLCGRAPHEGSGYAEVIHSVLHATPLPVRLLNPTVDRDTATICEKAMRADAGSRYGTAAELAQDIERRLVHKTIRARPAGLIYRARLWRRRNPLVVAASIAVMLLAVVLFAAIQWISRRKTLDDALALAAQARPEEADTKLGGASPFPWPWPTDKDHRCWIKIYVAEGKLEAAALRADRLSPDGRARELDELRQIITGSPGAGQLARAESLARCGAWWPSIKIIAEIVPCLEYFADLKPEPPPWVGQAIDKAFLVGMLGLSGAGYDNASVELSKSVSAPAGDKLRALRTVLERDISAPHAGVGPQLSEGSSEDSVGWRLHRSLNDKLRFSAARALIESGAMNSGLRRNEASFLLERMRGEALTLLEKGASPDVLAPALLLDAYAHLLHRITADGDTPHEVRRWVWLLTSLACREQVVNAEGRPGILPPPYTMTCGDLDGDHA